MDIYLSIILGLVFGGLCAFFAKKRGRNPINWFFWGLFFGVFSLIILFLIPPYVNGEKKKLSMAAAATVKSATKIQPLETAFERPLLDHPLKSAHWYYLDANHTCSEPITFDQLWRGWEDGTITDETQVWTEGMSDWQSVGELPYLKTLLEP